MHALVSALNRRQTMSYALLRAAWVVVTTICWATMAWSAAAQEKTYHVRMAWEGQEPARASARGVFIYASFPSHTCIQVLLEVPTGDHVLLTQRLDVVKGMESLSLQSETGWSMRLEKQLPGRWNTMSDFFANGQEAYEKLAEAGGALRWSAVTSKGLLLETDVEASSSEDRTGDFLSALRRTQASAELERELPDGIAEMSPFLSHIGGQRSRLGSVFDSLFLVIESVAGTSSAVSWRYDESSPVPGLVPRDAGFDEAFARFRQLDDQCR